VGQKVMEEKHSPRDLSRVIQSQKKQEKGAFGRAGGKRVWKRHENKGWEKESCKRSKTKKKEGKIEIENNIIQRGSKKQKETGPNR